MEMLEKQKQDKQIHLQRKDLKYSEKIKEDLILGIIHLTNLNLKNKFHHSSQNDSSQYTQYFILFLSNFFVSDYEVSSYENRKYLVFKNIYKPLKYFLFLTDKKLEPKPTPDSKEREIINHYAENQKRNEGPPLPGAAGVGAQPAREICVPTAARRSPACRARRPPGRYCSPHAARGASGPSPPFAAALRPPRSQSPNESRAKPRPGQLLRAL